MNKNQKEVLQWQLDKEKAVIKQLENQYRRALNDILNKMKILQADIDMLQAAGEADDKTLSLIRSKVYQKQYQEALKKQIEAILDKLHSDEFSTIKSYLNGCYEDGFIGTMYDIAGQGVPFIFPIDQSAAVKAMQLDSKVSKGLYTALGVDVNALKKAIAAEVTRGIASSLPYSDIARNIQNASKAPLNRARTIARTEGHRIQQQSAEDARQAAKSKGADVVKQWDAALDGRTRDSHRQVDGEIRESNEKFSNGLRYPGDSHGAAAEVVNCRCVALTRARWALDEDELQTLKDRAEYFGLDKAESFEEFKSKYLKAYRASGKAGDTDGYTTIDSVEPFDFNNKAAVQNVVNEFFEQYKDAQEEHAVVISPLGQLFRLTGTHGVVNTSLIGKDALIGSIGMHNHPIFGGFECDDSFSLADVKFSIEYKTGIEYLVSGTRRNSFIYTGELTVSEIIEEYEKSKYNIYQAAFENDFEIGFLQEDIMRDLAKRLKGFIFNEYI